jgi:hypothetical protein
VSWAREPLVHFLLFGALVVALGGPEVDEPEAPRRIVVDDVLAADLEAQLHNTLGRAPTADELHEAVGRWVRTEMLAREAFRRGLAQGDAVVRNRLATKMARVLAASEIPDEPDEATLRAWYDADPGRYRVDERLTLRQLLVASEPEAEDLRLELEAGMDPRDVEGLPPPGGPVLRARTPERLAALFGEAWVAGLDDRWRVLPSSHGWHVVRVESRVEGGPILFADARARVQLHWRSAQDAAAEAAAIAQLSSTWEVDGWP